MQGSNQVAQTSLVRVGTILAYPGFCREQRIRYELNLCLGMGGSSVPDQLSESTWFNSIESIHSMH